MNCSEQTRGDRIRFLDTFAAELTDAAYSVALRGHRSGSWLDLELDLWRALRHTVCTSDQIDQTEFFERNIET